MTDHSHDNWKPASNPWAVAIVVTTAVFMEILDTTIVNVALPHVAGSLSASYDESTGAHQLRWRTASCCRFRPFSAACLAANSSS